MRIPVAFKNILDKDHALATLVANTINVYQHILEENKLYFFEEYTDHGIRHIDSVLQFSARLIRPDTFTLLEESPKSIAWYILSVILHDLGMHLTAEGFYGLISGRQAAHCIHDFDQKTWPELWADFLLKAKRYNDRDKENIIGNRDWQYRVPPVENRDKLTGEDKKLIGEFIRIHHPRIAHEIALNGFPAPDGNLPFAQEMRTPEKYLVGLVARSHGMNVRDTMDFIKGKYPDTWTRPFGADVFFLMIVLRIADYCQIDAGRVNQVTLRLKTLRSPFSLLEHYTHLDLPYLQPSSLDPETLAFHCEPRNSSLFVKIKNLLSGLQQELDQCWAILGEVYGKDPVDKQPQIQYRRIKANIDNTAKYAQEVDYLPEKIQFTIAQELSRLLITPLYGNDPAYGVRELIQNAVDACRQRVLLEKNGYEGTIRITFYRKENQCYFRIEDDGIGMSADVLKYYYLRAGASYRTSAQWKQDYLDKDGNTAVLRNGRFGIGVLGAFLLGDTISVHTKALGATHGLTFTTTLDNEHIEIVKLAKQEAGTTIEIAIDRSTLRKLDWYESHSIRFDRWFVHASPRIIYDDQLHAFSNLGELEFLADYHDPLPADWYELPDSGYEKVQWRLPGEKPQYHPVYFASDLHFDRINLYINGITVSTPLEDPLHAISLQVFDLEGRFPLNLNRNSMNGSLPFRKQLIEDMLTWSFAGILFYPLAAPTLTSMQDQQPARFVKDPILGVTPLLSGKTGFVIATDYFKSKHPNRPVLSGGDTYLLGLLHAPDMENALIDIVPERGFVNWYHYHQTAGYKALIRRNAYSNFTLNELTASFDNAQRKEVGNNLLQIQLNYTDSIFELAPILAHIVQRDMREEAYVVETNLSYYSIAKAQRKRSGEFREQAVFNTIVQRYMNGHTEIPYDMEERKRLFPEAFAELERFRK